MNKIWSLDIPIFQGGMGVGVSLGSLAGAVAAEGGAGTISTAQIGFRESDFEKNPLEANLRAIGKEIKKAKKLACGCGAVGVNIMTVTHRYGDYVKEAIRQKADFIVSGAGLPMDLPTLAKGSDVKLVPIVSSVRAASVICRRWLKKEDRLPDAVVIEDPKAGGHLGFSMDEIEEYAAGQTEIDEVKNGVSRTFQEDSNVNRVLLNSGQKKTFQDEIRKIIEYIRNFGAEHQKYIPVIVAGGVRTAEDFQEQINLGADGVQMATAFVPTVECDAHPAFKEAYIKCKKEDIDIVKSPVGMPGRAIQNAFIQKASQQRIPPEKCLRCISVCKPAETPYCITKALINSVTGNLDEGLIFCGANAWKEDRIRTVKEVIRSVLPEHIYFS